MKIKIPFPELEFLIPAVAIAAVLLTAVVLYVVESREKREQGRFTVCPLCNRPEPALDNPIFKF